LAILLAGATIFYFAYEMPASEPMTYSDAIYATFTLIFFEPVLDYPDQWYLQILFYLIPILGLAVIADGVIRFGAALVNKQTRGQKWQAAMASTYNRHIIICGLGKVGYRITLELLKFGREIVAVEIDGDARFITHVLDLGVPVIVGDARRPENLIKAGVQQADAIVPASADELTNLDVALHARELNPNIKVVLRMFDPDLARRVETGFGIHTAYSTSGLAAPIFATAAMRLNVKHSFYVGETLLNLCEVEIQPGARIAAWEIQRVEAELDLSVVYYQGQEGQDMHPRSDQILRAGDKVLVLGTIQTLQRFVAMSERA
jgi:Trk K+ transport system NAD-binding subunit